MSEEKSLLKNTIVVGIGTLLSRVSGLLREILISSLFGATWVTDAFLLAYTIPNLLRRLFAEGALSTSIVPVFSEYSTEGRDSSRSNTFVASVFTGFTVVVGSICLLGIVCSSWIIRAVGVGFRGNWERLMVVTDFTRIMFPFLLLISWSALLMGVLNTVGVFSWSALAPVFFNLGTIFALLFLRPYLNFYVLAWGVIIGGILQFAFQIPPLYRKGLRLGIYVHFWRDRGFKQVVGLMLPVSFSLAVSQLNTLADRIIASMCEEGAISALYFADRLLELPFGVFGIALSTAILPALSRKALQENLEGWQEVFWQGVRWIVFLMIPMSIFLIVFSSHTVQAVYQRGLFSNVATTMTASALLFYAPGLVFFSLTHLLTRAFYSLKDSKTPVIIGTVAVFINIGLDLLFVRPFGFQGLALATSLTAVFNFVVLWIFMGKKYGEIRFDVAKKKWLKKIFLQSIVFTVLCKIVAETWYVRAERFPIVYFLGFTILIFVFYLLVGILIGTGEREIFHNIFQDVKMKLRRDHGGSI